ncbi:hypothetical protein NPIL_243211 [Nephila pilipes]|uniref:Uncharacterized protein n=1 Tax=Nephila pilipes TaxID=299642 RepID=A0A8X6Q0R8_NEPPI|nr:hypothetical protein NPIL_243211 [Nephila pilipes]
MHREREINPKNDKKCIVEFIIVDNKYSRPLIDYRTSEAMKLLTIEDDEFEIVNQINVDEYQTVLIRDRECCPVKLVLKVIHLSNLQS